MNTPPEPQPEGILLESAREAARISARQAARQAGISEGWWRQVVKGHTSASGGAYVPVSGVPAKTIARMALAVGLSPERMEAEGQRPDAAAQMRRQPAPAAQPPAGAPLAVADSDADRLEGELARIEVGVWTEISRHPPGTSPGVIFAHPAEAALMGMITPLGEPVPLPQRVRWIAEFRAVRSRSREAPETRRAG
jgi:hypothetical protein